MNNPLALRMLMAVVIVVTTGIGALALINLKFPENVIIAGIAAAVLIGTVWFVTSREKAARYDVYFRTVEELGRPLAYKKETAAFERDGTRFDVEFPSGEYHMYFLVTFRLPHLRQKFSIQNKTLSTTHHDDCYRIPEDNSPLPPEFLLQARNPDFLLKLLENRRFRDEVSSFDASMWTGNISISFDDGDFALRWTPPISEQIDGFYSVAHSAVVFYEELKKISVKYLSKEEV